MALALVFPGQGSQYVGMDRAGGGPLDAAVLEEADSALGYSLSSLLREGPESRLAETEVTQPAILTVSVALWRRLHREFPDRVPVAAAGHSLGEYSALVVAGSLDFADALRLVRLRGQAMQTAVPVGVGAMAAVMGLEPERVLELCEGAAQGEVVSPSALNGPGQIVVSGHTGAVDRLVEAAYAAGGAAKKLVVSAPFHCALMEPAARALRVALESVEIRLPSWPVYHNADGQVATDVAGIRERLVAQVVEPVRWERCVLGLKAAGSTRCIEVGPGKPLGGLIKRIDRGLPTLSLDTPGSWGAV